MTSGTWIVTRSGSSPNVNTPRAARSTTVAVIASSVTCQPLTAMFTIAGGSVPGLSTGVMRGSGVPSVQYRIAA
jgi:hypothetical protein